MSEDYILNQTFTDGKHSHPADLPFDAYIRAISLFGGEDGVLSHFTTRARSFAQWMAAHPDRLAVYLDGAMGLGVKDPIKSHFDRTVFVQLAEFSKRLTITRPSLPCTFTLAVEDRPKCKLLLALYPKPPSSDRTAGSSLRARLVGDDRGQFKPESAGEYASLLHPLPGRGTNATSVKAQPAQEPELLSSVAPEQEAAAGGNMYQQMIDILSQISPRTVEVGQAHPPHGAVQARPEPPSRLQEPGGAPARGGGGRGTVSHPQA